MNYEKRQPKNPPTMPPAKRGVIVVDTGSLIKLSAVFPHYSFTDSKRPEKPLFELLTFLSKHGYEVIIPEVVAHECDGFMRNYKTVEDYIGVKPRWVPEVAAFIRTIPSLIKTGHNIHIEPPPPEDESQGARLMRTLHEIAIKDTLSDKEKYHKSQAAYMRLPNKKHRGDIAAKHMIASFKKPCPPIYYMTEDQGAWNDVAALSEHLPVSRINTLGLYKAFAENALLPVVDIVKKPDFLINKEIEYQLSLRDFDPQWRAHPSDFSPNQKSGKHPLANALKGFLDVVKQDFEYEKNRIEALKKKYNERIMLTEEALRPEHPDDAHEDYVASHRLYLSHKPAHHVQQAEVIGNIQSEPQRYHD
jgi:hypothetical protein